MDKLLWVDMEMTGLDVDKEVIIEVAAIVTNMKMEILESYHSVVKQPQKYLDNMDDWNQRQHRDSGLVALIPSGKSPDVVEQDMIDLIDQHFGENEKVVIAGNSIGQDRLFINKYFRKLAGHLHYRMLDVTAFKIVFSNCFGVQHNKQSAHRAIEDIQESIKELKYYMGYIKV